MFGEGTYANPIKIEGATNVVLEGANPANSSDASIIKAYSSFESAAGATRKSIFEVSGSSNVTVSRFNFDFACVYDESVNNRDATLTPVFVHYRMGGITFIDTSGTISDNFIGNYYDMWSTLGLIVKPNPDGPDGEELGDNYQDLGSSFIPPERGTNHCEGRTRHQQSEYANRAAFGAIFALSTPAHIPTVDAGGKVTNLRPIRIEGNEFVNAVKPAIGISGWYDFMVRRNTIRRANNGIDISGGASGRVSSNTIQDTNLGVVYAPSWVLKSHPGRSKDIEAHLIADRNQISNVSGSAFALGFNHCADANKDGTAVHTNAEVRGNHISRYVYSSNNPVATSGVEIVVTSHFPHSYGPAEGLAHRREFGCDPAGAHDGERVRANIVSNTFEADRPMVDNAGNPHPDARPVAIIAVPPNPDFATDGKWQTTYIEGYSAWFEVNAHYNEFIGHETAVQITPGHVRHGRINATINFWGSGIESPASLIDDAVQMPSVAGIKYDPWLRTAGQAGWNGPYATGERELLTTSSTSQSRALVARLNEGEDPVVISVPAGATPDGEQVMLTVQEADAPAPMGFRVAGSPDVVDISLAAGDELLGPVTVCLPEVQGLSGEQVLLHLGDGPGARWRVLPKAPPPAGYASGWVCGHTSDFSFFMVAGTDPDILLRPARILRVEPSIRSATVTAGDVLRLELSVYGRQNILDNDLEDVSYTVWSDGAGGGSFDGSGRGVLYTAPSAPGIYSVTAELPSTVCGGTQDQCTAKFTIIVRRPSAALEERPAPENPVGEIPSVLVDAEGRQYEVFTPEEGGTFEGEGYSLRVDPGAVPNGEFVGIRISDEGAASNVGMTHQRYTLGGNMYAVSAVDGSGAAVSSYVLDDPAMVCMPLPDELRRNISDLAVVAINGDGSLTILSAQVRIGTVGTMVCGGLSNLHASVAVGSAGAPAPLPTAVPEPTPEAPDTGGRAPSTTTAPILTMLFGLIGLALGAAAACSRRGRRMKR